MMVMKRSLALALAGLLLVGLLAGCGRRSTSAASSVSQAPSSSESQPASSVPAQTEASTPSATPDEDENSVLTISDPAAAFASCLGWGPGSAGSSLKSVQAAADLLAWAEQEPAVPPRPGPVGRCVRAAGTTGWSLCSRRTWQRYGLWCRPMRRRC